MQTSNFGVRAAIARRLESDEPAGLVARLLGSVWGAAAAVSVARPLDIPPEARVIGIGSATLGGACKTPFAIALARALAERGADVALVGHAYRARPGRARVVGAADDVAEVGDDALFAARRLAGSGIDVVVGPHRQAATSFAARRARFLVLDGLLQARPTRIARSILLLGGARPDQGVHCPPAGDYRAPLSMLLGAADTAIHVEDELQHAGAEGTVADVVFRLDRATGPGGEVVPLPGLAGAAVGLLSTVARPARIVYALSRRGIRPVATLAFPDHHRPTRAELDRATARTTQRIDVWLTTGKCATKLPGYLAGAPVLALDQELRLSDRLIAWVADERSSPGRRPW